MRIRQSATALLLGAALCITPAFAKTSKKADKAAAPAAQTSASAATAPTPSAKAATPATAKAAEPKAAKGATPKSGPTQNASAADIASAKAKGLVWVNTSTGVYHKEGQFFGATKEGKFMTVTEAQKGGFRGAKEPLVAAKTAGAK